MIVRPAPRLAPLKTDRLTLSPVRDADAAWLQPVMERPEVNGSTLVIPTPCPAGYAREWVAAAVEANASGKAANYSISTGGKPVGAMFLIVNAAHGHAELGYFLDPSAWNQGYATEAARAMLRLGFEALGLHRIFAVHFGGNPASGKVMKKAGMRHEGCRRQHVKKNGAFVDIEQYGVLRGEWKEAGAR